MPAPSPTPGTSLTRQRLRRLARWLAALVLAAAGCQTPSQRLAGVGGMTGALAGAAIGGSRGNALTGAAVGGALGAISGAAVGDAVEASEARARQASAAASPGAVGVMEVIQMARSGLGDAVILNQVQSRGLLRPLEVNDLIALRNAGVSDQVILALQDSQPPPLQVEYAPPPPTPVIVEEVSFGGPPICWGPRRRGGVSWGISFSN